MESKLCNSDMTQINKHMMNNCSNAKVLKRYSQRHDNVLSLLADWILSTKSTEQEYCTLIILPSEKWDPIDQVFQPACRPDILVIEHSKIFVLMSLNWQYATKPTWSIQRTQKSTNTMLFKIFCNLLIDILM